MKNQFLTFLILAKIPPFSFSQNKDSVQIFDINIDSLVKINVILQKNKISINTVSLEPFSLKTIKNKQIRYSEAIDLLELLRTVSNIQVNADAYHQIALSYNGLWTKNGKILLVFDGHPLNFNLFGNYFFLRHLPVNQVKNITFKANSNNALDNLDELATINIKTDNYKRQFFISSKSEFTLKNFPLTQNFDLVFNKPLTQNLRLSLYFRHQFSNINTQKISNLSRSFTSNYIHTTNTFLHFNIFNKTTKFSILFDKYLSADSAFQSPHNYFLTFSSYFDKFKHITPKLTVRLHLLFQLNSPQFSYLSHFYDLNINNQQYPQILYLKYLAQINYAIHKNIQMSFSLNVNDQTTSSQNQSFFTPGVNKPFFILQSYYFNTTAHYKIDKFQLTAGINLVSNNLDNYLLAPEISASMNFDKLSIKQIFARTFRMPTLGDVIFAYQQPVSYRKLILQPETYIIAANQISIKPNSNLKIIITNSYNATQNAMNYYFTGQDKAEFINIGKYGTLSFDFAANYIIDRLELNSSITFYRPIIADKYGLYSFSETVGQYSGNSNLKFTGNVLVNFNQLKIYFSTVYIGHKYGYVITKNNDLELKQFSPTLLISPNLIYDFKKFQVKLSIYNLLNSSDYFVQAYKGLFDPMPYLGRTFRVSVKYKF